MSARNSLEIAHKAVTDAQFVILTGASSAISIQESSERDHDQLKYDIKSWIFIKFVLTIILYVLNLIFFVIIFSTSFFLNYFSIIPLLNM